MNRLAIVLWTLLLAAPTWAAGPQVNVVVGPKAPRLERFAAEELARQFKDLFDADVKVTTKLPGDAKHLVVVGSPATNPAVKKLAGGHWPKLSDQGHTLKSIGGNLVVGGGSPVATLWAVYELGHRFGIRYLMHGDVLPVNRPAMKLEGFDVVLEPTLRLRAWRTIGDSPIGPEAWGLQEHKHFLGQLAKLKFNRVVLAVHAWQPFVHYEFKGVKKQTSLLFHGRRFSVEGDTPGRRAFRGARLFENPDFAGKTSYDEKLKAGVGLVRGIIDRAHELGMTAALEFSPLEFPKEFARVQDRSLVAAQIRAYLTTYPAVDALYLDTPERVLPVDARWLTRKDGRKIEIVHSHQLGSSARRAVTQSEPPGKDGKHSLVLTLGDDHSGVLPQLATSHLHKLVGQMRKQGWDGYLARCWVPGDLNPSVHYLARAGFDARITPRSAYDDLLTPICGEGLSARVGKGFEMIEQATDLIDQNDPGFALPSPNVVMKHYAAKDPPPAWWKKVQGLYAEAMNEMYRGITRARGGARPVLLYHAKRLEFAVGYMGCIEALRQAGVAKSREQLDKQLEHLEKAVESMYNALNALGEVARDSSDRGVIAVLNEYGYRPLRAELEKVEKAAQKND